MEDRMSLAFFDAGVLDLRDLRGGPLEWPKGKSAV
jgi:hypothetical protein